MSNKKNHLRKKSVFLLSIVMLLSIASSFIIASTAVGGKSTVCLSEQLAKSEEAIGENLTLEGISSVNITTEYQLETFDTLTDAVKVGSYIYATGTSKGLLVFDVTNPAETSYHAVEYFGDTFEAIISDGTYLYVANTTSGIIVFDLVDPLKPAKVGEYLNTNATEIYGLAKEGNYLYALDTDGLQILNVNNPTNISYVNRFNSGGTDLFWYLAIKDNFVYILEENDLTVLNATDKQAIAEVYSNTFTDDFREIKIRNGILYFGGNRNFYIYNITNPGAPTEIASFDYGGGTTNYYFSMKGTEVYLSGDDYEVAVLDISNTSNLEIAYRTPTETFIEHTIVFDDFLFCYASMYVEILDLASSADSKTVWVDVVYDLSYGMTIYNNYLFWAYETRIAVYDISDKTNFELLSVFVNETYEIQELEVANGYLYVLDSEALRIIDFSDPTALEVIGELFLSGDKIALEVGTEYAYLGIWGIGIVFVDIFYPDNPQVADLINSHTTLEDLALSGNTLYVADDEVVFIYDISSPYTATILGNHTTIWGQMADIVVKGNYLYAGLDAAFEIVDISDPTDTTKISHYLYSGPTTLSDIDYDAGYVYTYANGRIDTFDVTVIEHPRKIGSLLISGVNQRLIADKGDIYLLNQNRGVYYLTTDPQLASFPSPALSYLAVFMVLTITTSAILFFRKRKSRQ